MLGRGVQGHSAVDLARALLLRFGGIRGVLNASLDDLQGLHGVGPGKAAALLAVRECCCRYLQEKLTPGEADALARRQPGLPDGAAARPAP